MNIRNVFSFTLFVGCLIALPLLVAAGGDGPVPASLDFIRARDLQSTVYFLSSAEMEGREAGTPANRLAAQYLAHRFELLGLEPAGENGSYFQSVPLVQAELSGTNELVISRAGVQTAQVGALLENFFPSPLSADADITAPVVFAGYGISAPEYGYDDYLQLEAAGKIVAIMGDEPGSDDPDSPFDGLVQSDHGSDYRKILNAQSHGAAGVLIFDPDRTSSLARAARGVWPESIGDSRFSLKLWVDQVRIPVAYVSGDVVKALFAGGPVKLDGMREKIDAHFQSPSVPLPGVAATVRTAISRHETSVPNVLARLPGAHPQLRDEVVIVSAHFDHVGVREGKVFHGADDDASGTAGVLEIAEAFSRDPQEPLRSILFVGWNAEERGLLGSHHYTEEPLVQLERTAALFQMDMIGRNQEVPDSDSPRFRGMADQTAEQNENSLNVLGYSRSQDLYRSVQQLNRAIGLDLKFELDNHELNLLRRSDNWPFLIRGVPTLFFTTGLHPDYHTPLDTADRLNYSKMERIVRLVYLCAREAARTPAGYRLDQELAVGQ